MDPATMSKKTEFSSLRKAVSADDIIKNAHEKAKLTVSEIQTQPSTEKGNEKRCYHGNQLTIKNLF